MGVFVELEGEHIIINAEWIEILFRIGTCF